MAHGPARGGAPCHDNVHWTFDASDSAARTLQYRGSRVRVLHLGPECQLVGGKCIEAIVVEAFLQATEEAGPAAAALPVGGCPRPRAGPLTAPSRQKYSTFRRGAHKV